MFDTQRLRWEGLAWIASPRFIALPATMSGLYWPMDITGEQWFDATAFADVVDLARAAGADVDGAFWVPSRAYLLNPWKLLDEARRAAPDTYWVPEWFDDRVLTAVYECEAGR